jgi:hypothetical protein
MKKYIFILYLIIILISCNKKENIINNVIPTQNEIIAENEVTELPENPYRQIIIGKWWLKSDYASYLIDGIKAKEWDFYGDGTFAFSLIAGSLEGKWEYEDNKIFIKEPLWVVRWIEPEVKTIYEEHDEFYIDVEIIDDNNMNFTNNMDYYFGEEYCELLKIK